MINPQMAGQVGWLAIGGSVVGYAPASSGGRDREAVPWGWGHGPLRDPPNLPLPLPIEP
jgi:hypothetical protein